MIKASSTEIIPNAQKKGMYEDKKCKDCTMEVTPCGPFIGVCYCYKGCPLSGTCAWQSCGTGKNC